MMEFSTEKIHRDTNLSETIFLFSPDGFVGFNAQKQVIQVNPAFVKLTGLEKEAWLGLSEDDFKVRFLQLCCAKDGYVSGTWPTVVEFSYPDSTIQRYTVSKIISPLTSDCIIQFQEITDEHEERKRLKSEFLADAAHALRTPVSAIQGFAELLLNNSFEASVQKEILGIIKEESVKIISLINAFVNSSAEGNAV